MNLVDANVLIYARNRSDTRHAQSREWLDAALGGDETVGFPWVSLLAFLRLATKIGLFPEPLSVREALEQVGTWLSSPTAVVAEPGARHFDLLAGLVEGVGTGGNLVTDAHLATLALEHRATIVTFDGDFGRFPGVSSAAPIPPGAARPPT